MIKVGLSPKFPLKLNNFYEICNRKARENNTKKLTLLKALNNQIKFNKSANLYNL